MTSRGLSVAFYFRGLLGRAPMVLPGLYAWLATVASLSVQQGAPSAARLSAFGALLALVVGPWVGMRYPFAGRLVLGVGFVGLSLVTWLVLGDEILPERLEPLQAVFGGLGWVAFGFSWGSHYTPGGIPEEHPNAIAGDPLPSRARLPLAADLVLLLALGGGVALLGVAWRVQSLHHALLAHAIAVSGALLLLSTGAHLATQWGGSRVMSPVERRLTDAVKPLALLALLVMMGVLWLLLG